MKIENDEPFIRRVETLIDPAEVGDLGFIQRFKKLMPKALFKRLLVATSRKNPYIGFVIEPYCLFLFFRLTDVERAKAMLPDRYELIPSPLFAGEEPAYYQGLGVFGTRGSTFWGTRLESYLIARDRETGLVSWVFIDILSNTLIALPKEGVADRNARRAIHTTNSKGELLVDFRDGRNGERRLELKASVTGGKRLPLDQPLWIGGNTSVAFARDLCGREDDPFAVIFDPAEVETALDIPVSDIDVRANTLFPGLAEAQPVRSICFPYAQHYIADSPGCRTYIRDENDMVEAYRRIAGMERLTTFSTKGIKVLLGVTAALSLLGNVFLLTRLLF